MTDETPPAAEPESPASPETAADLAADTLGRDLLAALVDELKVAPDCWQKMSQSQQDQTIYRLSKRVQTLIGQALAILFRGDYPSCRAVIDAVQFKDGIKAVLKIGKTEHSRHELADAVGQAVIIVMSSPDEYFGRMEEIKAQRQQPDLPFDSDGGVAFRDGYTGGDGRAYRKDEPGIGAEDLPEDPDAPAPEAPPDLTLEHGPLWEQARDALAIVGIIVADDIAREWTEEQCGQAAYWAAQAKDKGISGAPIIPDFIPLGAEKDDETTGELPFDDDSPTTDEPPPPPED
jgi:hypothetical protein